MKNNQQSNILTLFSFMVIGLLWFGFRLRYGELRTLPVFTVLNVLILSPVLEELLFRGILQKFVKERLSGGLFAVSYANILVSFIFAILHIPMWGVVHSVLVFLPSLIFGFLYDKTGKIYYSGILHMFYNLNIFIV